MAIQTFKWRSAYGTNPSYKADIRSFEFGDGYQQVSPKGLNPVRQEVTVVLPGLTKEGRKEVLAFLAANAGKPFLYAHDGDEPKKYMCDEWNERKHGPNVYEINATFKQLFTNV